MLPEKKLLLADLRTNRQRELPDVVQYAFSNDGRVLVTLNAKQQLNIGKPDGSATDVIESVTGFYLNNGGTAMVYTIAKEKGSLTADELTLMLEASKIMEKLKGEV